MSGLKKLSTAFAGLAATLALAVPTSASAGLIGDVVGGVNDTVNDTVGGLIGGGGGGGGGSAGGAPVAIPAPGPAPAPQAAEDDPAISTDNPHAQGEVLDTGATLPGVGPIDAVVGQSGGEQDDEGNYSGHVTIVSALGLDVGVQTDEDNPTETSPLDPINNGVLGQLCTASTVCLTALDFNSTTTKKGSTNNFSVLSADVGDGAVTAGVVESEGNIAENDKCQRADASSSAANLGAAGLITAGALSSESSSEACRNGDESAEGDSEVLNLNGTAPLGALGCDPDAVDDEFALPLLIEGFCNADDTNGSQAEAPYNIRKALGLDLLEVLNAAGIFLDLDAATSESLAQAPEGGIAECPDPDNPACIAPPPECPDPDNPECDDDPRGGNDPEGPGGPGGPSADTPDEALPFTGADLGMLGLIGGLVMAGGLGLMALADRRRNDARG